MLRYGDFAGGVWNDLKIAYEKLRKDGLVNVSLTLKYLRSRLRTPREPNAPFALPSRPVAVRHLKSSSLLTTISSGFLVVQRVNYFPEILEGDVVVFALEVEPAIIMNGYPWIPMDYLYHTKKKPMG